MAFKLNYKDYFSELDTQVAKMTDKAKNHDYKKTAKKAGSAIEEGLSDKGGRSCADIAAGPVCNRTQAVSRLRDRTRGQNGYEK